MQTIYIFSLSSSLSSAPPTPTPTTSSHFSFNRTCWAFDWIEMKEKKNKIFTNFTCSDKTNEHRWQIRFTPAVVVVYVPRHIVFAIIIIIFISFYLSSVYWHCGIVKFAHVYYSGEHSQQLNLIFSPYFIVQFLFICSSSIYHFILSTDKAKQWQTTGKKKTAKLNQWVSNQRQTDANGHLIQRLSGVNQNTEITPCLKSWYYIQRKNPREWSDEKIKTKEQIKKYVIMLKTWKALNKPKALLTLHGRRWNLPHIGVAAQITNEYEIFIYLLFATAAMGPRIKRLADSRPKQHE